MTPEDQRDMVRKLMDSITLAACDLNVYLRAANALGIDVPVDTVEQDGWTKVIVNPPLEEEE